MFSDLLWLYPHVLVMPQIVWLLAAILYNNLKGFWSWRSVLPLILLFSATKVCVISFTAQIARRKILLLRKLTSSPSFKARLYDNMFLLKRVNKGHTQRFLWQILISLEAGIMSTSSLQGKGHCISLFGTCQLWTSYHYTSLSPCHTNV